MEQYKLENLSDGNVSEILESNTLHEAALEALEKLGWHIVIVIPHDDEIEEIDEEPEEECWELR